MEKFETPEGAEQAYPVSEEGPEPAFVNEELAPVASEHHEEQIAVIEAEIHATLREEEKVSPEISQEVQNIVPSRSEEHPGSTFLDRHPSLSKLMRRVMLVAGLGVSGSAFAQDDITVHQQVGGGQAVPVWSGNETVGSKATLVAPKAKSSQAQKGGDSSASAKKAAPNNGSQTVIVNGRVVSSGENLGGVTLKGNTVIIDGKTIPLEKSGHIEIDQKADKIEGNMTGVTIK